LAETFLYEDGVELSLGAAYTILQNVANNRIRNLTRIITQSPGFLEDSFKVTALEKDASQSSSYYLKMEAGGVVFPNGEVFKGNEFICRIAVTKAATTQYLKVKQATLYRTEQEQAFGGTEYAEILDGAILDIDTDPEPASDGSELLIASINYFPDMEEPKVTDIRDPWIFFWSSSTIIDPQEILDFTIDDVTIISSKATINTATVNYIDAYDINSEISAIVSIPQTDDDAMHAWDLLVESSYPEVSGAHRRSEPFPVVSQSPSIVLRLPHGLEAVLALRKHDAYRAGVATEWVQTDSEVEIDHSGIEDADIQIDTEVHAIQPYVGIRVYTPDSIGKSCSVKIWISEQDDIDTDSPPRLLMGIPGSVDDNSYVPYFVLPFRSGAQALYMAYQVLNPAHRIVASGTQQIPYSAPDYGDEETFCIEFGGDGIIAGTIATAQEDDSGQVVYYGEDGAGGFFYLPRTQESPTNEYGQPVGKGPERYLSDVEFINYAPYESWSVTGATLEYWGATKNAHVTISYNPPIATGDTVTIRNSTIAADVPNGTYTVTAKIYDGTNWKVVFNSAAGGGGDNSGTCDIDDNESTTVPLADLEIYDTSDRGAVAIYSGTQMLGQDRDVHFPDSYFSKTDLDLNRDDHIFYEGRTYGLRITRDSGGWQDRMNINGVLKLTFVKKVVGST